MYKPLTIKSVSEKYTPKDEYTLFGQFLDDFRNEKDDKYALIQDEPNNKTGMELFICILAATAHKLANDNDLPVPEWVLKQQYVYTGVHYAFNTQIEEYREHLKKTSPAEFKQRNIFLGDNVLSRI